MTSKEDFLAAIAEDPNDLQRIGVYADFLRDHDGHSMISEVLCFKQEEHNRRLLIDLVGSIEGV